MSPAAILSIVVRANTAEANAALMRTDALMRSTAAAGTMMGARVAAATRALSVGTLAVGVIAGKMAMDFQRNMTLVQTQAGASAKEVQHLSVSVLNLARNSQFSPDQLAQGLFRVESHGYHGAKAMNVLTDAMKLATVGQSDLEQTAFALSAALNSGIKGTHNMGRATGQLNAIVGLGSMRMDELVGALNTGLLPAGVNFGLSLRQVGAGLDVMTRAGMPAQLAATRLRMTFSLLAAQSDRAKKALEPIGLAGSQLAKDMRKSPDGLITAIQDLHDHLQGVNKVQQAQILSEAFGGGRSSSAIMTLVGHTKELRDLYGQINQKANEFPKDYAATQQTAAFKLHRAWNSIQADLITLGHDIAPIIAMIAQAAATVLHLFTMLPGGIKTTVFEMGLLAWPILKAAGAISSMAAEWGIVNTEQATAAEGANVYAAAQGRALTEEEAQAAALRTLVAEMNALNVEADAFVLAMTEATATMEATGALGGGPGMAAAMGARRPFGSAIGGLGLAAGGVIGAQMLGGAVGGGAGHQISTLGTGAAIGAGLGMFSPIGGPLGGAALGAAAAGIIELATASRKAYDPVKRFNTQIGNAHAAMRAAADAEHRWTKANDMFAPTQHHLNRLIAEGKGGTDQATKSAQKYIDVVTGRQQAAKQFHDEISKLADKTHRAEIEAQNLVTRYERLQKIQTRINNDPGSFSSDRALARAQSHVDAGPSRADVAQALGNARALRDSLARDLQAHKIKAPITIDQGQLSNEISQTLAQIHASKKDRAKIQMFLQHVPAQDATAARKAVESELNKGHKGAILKIIADKNTATVQVAQLMKRVGDITGAGGKKAGDSLTKNMNDQLKPGMTNLTQFIKTSLNTIQTQLNMAAKSSGSNEQINFSISGIGQNAQGKAMGGLLDGLPTGDNIPILAQGGEYVVNAVATKKHLPLLHAINNETPEYAGGGHVPAVGQMAANAGAFEQHIANQWAKKHLGGKYTFPFKDINGFTWGRTDMGLDSTGAGPVVAAGDGTIIQTGAPGWPGGGGWVLKFKGGAPSTAPGPKTDTMYQYEHLNAKVHSGQTVRTGQVLGTQIAGFPFQETGWAASGSGTPLDAGSYTEGKVMPAGQSMTRWLHTLAAHKHAKGGHIGGSPLPAYNKLWDHLSPLIGRGGQPPPELVPVPDGHGYTYTQPDPTSGPNWRPLYKFFGSQHYRNMMAKTDISKGSLERNATLHEWAFETNPWGLGEGGAIRVSNKWDRMLRAANFLKGGRVVGASMYGGPTDSTVNGDSGAYGHLNGTMGFAELEMGHALGGLAPHTKLAIGYKGKSVIGEKLDIGAGGSSVSGHKRAIDLWYQTANALGFNGLGLVQISKQLKQGSTGSASLGHHGKSHNITRQQANQLGIPNFLYNKVVAVQNNINASSEMADRISQLGTPINGHTEVEELTNELQYLLQLRNLLINIYKNVYKAKGKHAKELHKITNEIKKMEKHKPQPPGHQRIPTGKGVTNNQKNAVNQANQQAEAGYHKRLKSWTNKLSKLKKEQGHLSSLTTGSGTSSATGATTAVKQLLDQTQGTQFGTDDPIGMKVIKTLPPVGVLGGDIFNVQMKLRDLNASTAASDNSAYVSALQADNLSLQQRLNVANAQAPILTGIPDMISRAAGSPFLGGFATGGVIPGSGVALIGEHGPELVDFSGGGARVSSAAESRAAGANVHVTLEDNRTAVYVDDELVREIFHNEMSSEISKARRKRG